MKLDNEALCKTIQEIIADGHQVEIKEEKGYLLVVSVYAKRKVILKQKMEE